MAVSILYDKNEIYDVINSNIRMSKEIKFASGYFSYKIFEMFKESFSEFTNKGGKFFLTIGSDTDVDTIVFLQNIQKYSKAGVLSHILKKYFNNYKDVSDEALVCLFEMFDKNQIEIKIGISKDGGIFHVKEYIFKGESFSSYLIGSLNFTKSALVANHESLGYVRDETSFDDAYNMFDQRWNNMLDDVSTHDLNEFLKSEAIKEIAERNIKISTFSLIKPREYQQDAIDELMKYDFNGFLEMATGTGKTFTTIFGLKQFFDQRIDTYLTTIIVPSKMLASQWEEELYEVLGDNIEVLQCHSSNNNWKKDYSRLVSKSKSNNVVVIFVIDSFFNNTKDLEIQMRSTNNILIVDEAHNLVSEKIEVLEEYKTYFKHNIALSATPQSYFDEERTEKLFKCFSGGHYKFSLAKAIEEGHLVKYLYYPHIVDLDNDEIERYNELSRQLKETKDNLKKFQILEDRTKVLSKASNKIDKLIEVASSVNDLTYTLIYCNPGDFKSINEEDVKYIDYVSKQMYKYVDLSNIHLDKVIGEVSLKKRDEIAKSFSNGELDIILAIKCLDEGVNIPSIRQAFILYSTRNPREFIQRRGRLLRKHDGKEIAIIHDFIVRVDGVVPEDEKNRFEEYSSLSENNREHKYFKLKYMEE